jgi:ATP-binding protein involved in chromosome partitioning
MLNREQILARLREVAYPGFTRDIVSSGVIGEVRLGEGPDGPVEIELKLPAQSQTVAEKIQTSIVSALAPEIKPSQIRFGDPSASSPPSLNVVSKKSGSVAQAGAADGSLIPGVKNVVAVASGKGGVGKSTVAVNLAVALAKSGHSVGLLDADIYGPSIPIMMGVAGQQPRLDASRKRLIPFERFGVKFMSLGVLVDQSTAVIWRGPMVMKALEQLLRDVVWGELDYLILDMPPGTGDAQLTVSQRIQLAGAVIVSTPQDVALADAVKGVSMFQKVNVPILGLIENMSYFHCPQCQAQTDVFGHGGAKSRAESLDVPFLGELPLDSAYRESGDAGTPLIEHAPDSAHAKIFMKIAADIDRAVMAEPASERPSFLKSAAEKLGFGKRNS